MNVSIISGIVLGGKSCAQGGRQSYRPEKLSKQKLGLMSILIRM